MLDLRWLVCILNYHSQPFWGKMVAHKGAGPPPIPRRRLTVEKLSQAIQYCASPVAKEAAAKLAEEMRLELGVKAAVQSFHRHLPKSVMSCDLISDLPATWTYKKSRKNIKISGAAAEILIQSRRIQAEDLQLYKPKPIIIENRRWDFVTSSVSVSMGVSYDILASLSGFWRNPQELRKRKEKEQALTRATTLTSQSSVGEEDDRGSSSKDIAKMVGASAMSIPHFTAAAVKGFVVDLPYAMAEGFRNTPRIYGEKIADHSPVTDWKSGVVVASTSFARQMAEGVTDILVQPVKGAAKDGVVGFGTGLGKGALQTVTKPAAGMLVITMLTLSSLLNSRYGPRWLHRSGSLQVDLLPRSFQNQAVSCLCSTCAGQVFHSSKWCRDRCSCCGGGI